MYQQYLQDKPFLTDEASKAREQEIVNKEKAATELRYKYFGPDGELYQNRQSLLKPIQDDVYNAIKTMSADIRRYSTGRRRRKSFTPLHASTYRTRYCRN